MKSLAKFCFHPATFLIKGNYVVLVWVSIELLRLHGIKLSFKRRLRGKAELLSAKLDSAKFAELSF